MVSRVLSARYVRTMSMHFLLPHVIPSACLTEDQPTRDSHATSADVTRAMEGSLPSEQGAHRGRGVRGVRGGRVIRGGRGVRGGRRGGLRVEKYLTDSTEGWGIRN